MALVLLATISSACALPPPTLTVTTVVPNLNHPWDIAFTPDGTMIYTERIGKIDAFIDGQTRVLAAPTDVYLYHESGMLGLAVDPQFSLNRRIYTCFVSNLSGAIDVRVVRWTVNANYTALSNRTDILPGIASVNGEHSGCRPRFGPDGYLWVGTGDARTPTNPQDKQSLAGKVLRITTDGKPAPGNPGGALRGEIYNYGHRNVQGIAFRPTDGMGFDVEHGTICDDEVNRLVAGANYGWDPVGFAGPTVYDEFNLMTDYTKFPDAIGATWASSCPTVAPSGATFLVGPQWKAWNGKMAVATLKQQTLYVLSISEDGKSNTGFEPVLQGQGRLRVPVQGPDGNLYVAVDADAGSIIKVTPS